MAKRNRYCCLTYVFDACFREEAPTLLGAKRLGKMCVNGQIYHIEDVTPDNKIKSDAIERWYCDGDCWVHEFNREGCWGCSELENTLKDAQNRGFKCEVYLTNKQAVNEWFNYLNNRKSSNLKRYIPKNGATFVGNNFDEILNYCRKHPQTVNALLTLQTFNYYGYSYFDPTPTTIIFVKEEVNV